MRRGFVRGSIRHPASGQVASLEAKGVTIIYTDGDGAENWDEALKSMREKETIYVETLARVAPTRDGIRAAIEDADERKVTIEETATGRRSDDLQSRTAMIFDAVDELAQDRRTFTPAQARKAAKLKWETERTSKAKARAIWKDVATYPKNKDALAHPDMRGWSQRMAYRELKKRGHGLGGPKPKQ